MKRVLAIVAAFLLFDPIEASVATAAEKPEHLTTNASVASKQKKVEKFLMMLKAIGLSDPALTEVIYTVESRTKNGYLMLHQEDIADGVLSLGYKLQPKIGAKQLELKYTPKDSNFEYKAHTNSVMLEYKMKF